jgi:hypothetical protein
MGSDGAAASGIFCLLDRRTEEVGCGSVARLFSALETFRFRDSDVGGAVGGEGSGKAAAEAGDAPGARAAWLAAWRAEDLVILGDMRNLPTRLLARARDAGRERMGGGRGCGGGDESENGAPNRRWQRCRQHCQVPRIRGSSACRA